MPKLLLDRGKIEQVLINLFNNAIDAMPKGGKLYVRSYMSGKKAVVVEVEDTGTGIDKDIMTKIFEPFFTTKNRAEGTGLGLPVAKSIIDMHEGLITVESEKGKGAKFTVLFRAPEEENA
jgi:signal transduction histidine kinase